MAFADFNTPTYNYVPSEMEKANSVKLLLETAKLNGIEITQSFYMDLIEKVYSKPFAEKLAEKYLGEEDAPIFDRNVVKLAKM